MKRWLGGLGVLILSIGLWLAAVQPVLADDQAAGNGSSPEEEGAVSGNPDFAGTPAGTDSTAAADSTRTVNLSGIVAQPPDVMLPALEDADRPLIESWTFEPRTGIGAEVRRVRYWGELGSNMRLDKGAVVNITGSYSTEDYRKQDKTVEKKDGTLTHNTGMALPVATSLNLGWSWMEDRTVNSAGVANLNKNDTKRGSLTLSKREIYLLNVKNDFVVDGSVNDQKGESQRQRIDSSSNSLAGGWRAGIPLMWGFSLATGVFRRHSTGNDFLGDQTSPSSSDEDSLRAGVYYRRGLWQGRVTVRRSNFDRRFLDYNRNSNGLVDTTAVGVQKIVDELEQKDAVSYEWSNQVRLGRFNVGWLMARDTGVHGFQASGVGDRERLQDQVTTDLSYRYAALDSVKISMGYLWKWDDQIYKDATAPRGKQINQMRDFGLEWSQHLSRRTKLLLKYSESLSQDIAEKRFNENDRDRHETFGSLRADSDWDGRFKANMVFSYRQIQDLSIRTSRSANNNIKETYEITPGYHWPLSSWITLQQNFLLSIQFTDYVFSQLEQVNRDDDYNKRGTLNTNLIFSPNRRLVVTVSHNYNARFNATRTTTDAAGNKLYHIDLEQKINTIDLALTYEVSPWFTLDGATFRTKDVKETFGRTNSTIDNRSGEIWLGGTVNKRWGSQNPLVLSGTARKYLAYGPNVQESNKEYWDANLTLSWQF